MFSSIANCLVGPRVVSNSTGKHVTGRPIHSISIVLDIIAGVALLAIGIAGNQLGFLTPAASYALIGVGSAYIGLMLTQIVVGCKVAYAPESFLVKPVFYS